MTRAKGTRAQREPGGGTGGGQPRDAAMALCLRLLTAAPRTRAQLAEVLRRKRVPDEVATAVLDRCADVGLIDDAAFAEAWVESRQHGRGLARRALAAELRQRGVDEREVRSAVGTISPDDELAAARRLVARRIAVSRGKPLPALARQLTGLLARKGYPPDLASRVVREALGGDGAAVAAGRADGDGQPLEWVDGADEFWDQIGDRLR